MLSIARDTLYRVVDDKHRACFPSMSQVPLQGYRAQRRLDGTSSLDFIQVDLFFVNCQQLIKSQSAKPGRPVRSAWSAWRQLFDIELVAMARRLDGLVSALCVVMMLTTVELFLIKSKRTSPWSKNAGDAPMEDAWRFRSVLP